MGLDQRMEIVFESRTAYGGSCFPKDTRALIDAANRYKINLSIVKSTVKSNNLEKCN